jgi:hypothetical protein
MLPMPYIPKNEEERQAMNRLAEEFPGGTVICWGPSMLSHTAYTPPTSQTGTLTNEDFARIRGEAKGVLCKLYEFVAATGVEVESSDPYESAKFGKENWSVVDVEIDLENKRAEASLYIEDGVCHHVHEVIEVTND